MLNITYDCKGVSSIQGNVILTVIWELYRCNVISYKTFGIHLHFLFVFVFTSDFSKGEIIWIIYSLDDFVKNMFAYL